MNTVKRLKESCEYAIHQEFRKLNISSIEKKKQTAVKRFIDELKNGVDFVIYNESDQKGYLVRDEKIVAKLHKKDLFKATQSSFKMTFRSSLKCVNLDPSEIEDYANTLYELQTTEDGYIIKDNGQLMIDSYYKQYKIKENIQTRTIDTTKDMIELTDEAVNMLKLHYEMLLSHIYQATNDKEHFPNGLFEFLINLKINEENLSAILSLKYGRDFNIVKK